MQCQRSIALNLSSIGKILSMRFGNNNFNRAFTQLESKVGLFKRSIDEEQNTRYTYLADELCLKTGAAEITRVKERTLKPGRA
jgi:hypothetical protein